MDRLSINPKYQTFEKFISGMYLGEIVRLIAVSLVDAVPQPLLFKGKSTAALNKHYGLDTSFMSQVEEAWIGEDHSEGAYELPPLGSDWDESKLNAKVVPKLQRLKEIVATTLEYKLEEVSYRDAAVGRVHSYPNMQSLRLLRRFFAGYPNSLQIALLFLAELQWLPFWSKLAVEDYLEIPQRR